VKWALFSNPLTYIALLVDFDPPTQRATSCYKGYEFTIVEIAMPTYTDSLIMIFSH